MSKLTSILASFFIFCAGFFLICHPLKASDWRSVDTFREEGVREGVPHALVTLDNTVFSVGTANGPNGGWVVRRSFDRGETWSTVDRYRHDGFGVASAGGAAVDSRTQHIYVAGAISQIDGNAAGWVVRKSTDNGNTWATVDEVMGNYAARKIAVDHRGIIYVVGSWDGEGGFLRRSIDGGLSWRTIVYATTRIKGYSVVTAPDGRVFVGGIDGLHGWHIFSSANGLTDWEEVDHLPTASGAEYGAPGDAHITKGGLLLFSGIMSSYGGLVRSAHFKRFRHWNNLFCLKRSRVSASTSTKNGKIYVTGIIYNPTDDRYSFYTTWTGRPGRSFTISDQFRQHSQAFGSPIDHSYGGAAVTKAGDILTTQFWAPEEGEVTLNNWIVRKLRYRKWPL